MGRSRERSFSRSSSAEEQEEQKEQEAQEESAPPAQDRLTESAGDTADWKERHLEDSSNTASCKRLRRTESREKTIEESKEGGRGVWPGSSLGCFYRHCSQNERVF